MQLPAVATVALQSQSMSVCVTRWVLETSIPYDIFRKEAGSASEEQLWMLRFTHAPP